MSNPSISDLENTSSALYSTVIVCLKKKIIHNASNSDLTFFLSPLIIHISSTTEITEQNA